MRIIFVFLSFAFMVTIGSIFVSNIISNEVRDKVNLALSGTESTINAYLHGTKIVYESIYRNVQDMLYRGESLEAVTRYMLEITDMLINQNEGSLGIVGVHGYINERLAGISYNLGGGAMPQHRSWYQQAIRYTGATYTAPYYDRISGKTVMSLTQLLYGKNGESHGVLVVDIDTAWLIGFLGRKQFSEGGYGLITNQFINIIAHPQSELINQSLQSLGNGYAEISNMLRTNEEVSAKRIKDTDGTNIIVFFRSLHNEWFLGLIIPVRGYNAELYSSIIILSVLGVLMTLMLSYILLRISNAKMRSEEENKVLQSKVFYDALTGIYNRRYMEDSMKRIIKSLARTGGVLSIMMLDIDFFKKYNDTYGHDAGDVCLKSVANALSQCITRADDFVARYGGEEFIAILPNTDEPGAHYTASKLLECVRILKIPHEKSDIADYVTISIGVTTVDVKHEHDATNYIKCADKALYMSKQSGRNKYTYIEFASMKE